LFTKQQSILIRSTAILNRNLSVKDMLDPTHYPRRLLRSLSRFLITSELLALILAMVTVVSDYFFGKQIWWTFVVMQWMLTMGLHAPGFYTAMGTCRRGRRVRREEKEKKAHASADREWTRRVTARWRHASAAMLRAWLMSLLCMVQLSSFFEEVNDTFLLSRH
jgi:hypothetical protein